MPDRYSSISIDSHSRPHPTKSAGPHRKREPFLKKIFDKIPRNPYLITLCCIVFLFAIYCLSGFFLVPLLIEKKLPGRLEDHTKMELRVGNATFNPFTFHLHLKDITIYDTNGSTRTAPFFTASNMDAVLAPLPLFQKELVCRSLQIDKPAITVIRYPNNIYNLSRLFGNPEGETPKKRFEFPGLPFLFSFSNFSISNGSLIFNDRTSGKIHKVEKILLTLPTLANFYYKSRASVSPSFSASIDGSPIQLTGEASMARGAESGQTRLTFDLHSLDLSLYSNYLPLSFPVQLTKGTANGQIQVSFVRNKGQSQRLTVLLQLDTTGNELSTKDGSLIIRIPTAKLEGEFQPFTGNLLLQNVLFHEPEIWLKSDFSEKTLDSLLPETGKSPSGSFAQRSTSLFSMDLFIMDNGILHIDEGKKGHEKTYRSLQLSIKNYDQQATGKNTSGKKCSFKLSGEQLSPPASFSWQGMLDEKSVANGTLQLNRFPASLLGSIFTQDKATSMTGTADVTGNLSVQRNPGAAKPFSYVISEGAVKISDLFLFDGKQRWLHADSFALGPLDSKNKMLDIGNITVQGASLAMRKGHLPHILESFIKKGSRYKLHGMDFSGRIQLLPTDTSRPSLVFDNLAIQANNLDKNTKDRENVTLHAKIDQTGTIYAKGRVALNPFQASLAVQFTGMPLQDISPWYTESPFLLGGNGLIDGVGRLTYPEYTYKGTLTVSNALFSNREAKSKLSWSKAELQDLTFSKTPFYLSIGSAVIDHPIITYSQPNNTSNILSQTASFIRSLLPRKKKGSAKESSSSDVLIKTITLTQGTVAYNDLRLNPPWHQEVVDFAGEIHNFSRSSATTPADFTFSGMIAGNPLKIQGTMNPFAENLTATSSLTFSGMPVAEFKDQLSPLFSLDTGKGTFDLTLQDTFNEGKETGEAHYLFHGLSPMSSTSEIALPLALLAGQKDTIELHLPLLDPDDKEIHPVFFDATNYFKRLIVKSVIAPLLLTSDNFSGLTTDDTPDFLPGDSALSAKGKAKLTLYRDLLAAHPRLTVEIIGTTNSDTDSKALQEKLMEIEKKRVEAENKKRAQEWEQLQNKKPQPDRNKTIVEQNIPADQLAKYAPILPKQISVSDQDMENLARQRTTIAYDFLTKKLGLNPARVKKLSNASHEPNTQRNRIQISLSPLTAPPQPQAVPPGTGQ